MKPKKQTPLQAYLLELLFARPLHSERQHISSGADANTFIRGQVQDGTINHKEYFWMIVMTRSHRVLGMKEISSGKTHSTTISFKEVAQVAFLSNACSCILVHNHPSGNVNPSENDLKITIQAKKVLKLIDVTLLDHIIITQEELYSFAEHHQI